MTAKKKTYVVHLPSTTVTVKATSVNPSSGQLNGLEPGYYFNPAFVAAVVPQPRMPTLGTALGADPAVPTHVADPSELWDVDALEARWQATGELPEELVRPLLDALHKTAQALHATGGMVPPGFPPEMRAYLRTLMVDPAREKVPPGGKLAAEYEDA